MGNKLRPILLLISILFFGAAAKLMADEMSFAKSLYDNGEYYRAVTEFWRLYASEKSSPEMRLYSYELLLGSSLKLGDTQLAANLLNKVERKDSRFADSRIELLIAIDEGNHDLAQDIYDNGLKEADKLGNIPMAYDTAKAVTYSKFLPGSGLFYIGEYKKGFGVLFINAFFLYLTYYFGQSQNYGAALVSLYGGFRFYQGNLSATEESAIKNNIQIKKNFLNQVGLSIERKLLEF